MAEYLSPHFTLEELTRSATATARGISNKPTELHKKCLVHTCQYLLEPLRTLLNEKYKVYKGKEVKKVAIGVSSGYRSEALNKVIPGASKTSSHCKGYAVDITAVVVLKNEARIGIPYTELYENIKKWVKEGKLSVDQCIEEKKGSSVWVHVSHHPSGRTMDRRQFLKYNGKSYTLDVWLK